MTAIKTTLAGLAAAILLAAPASAHTLDAHAGSLDTGGMSEKRLHRFEVKLLGPEHAAEHARMRKAIREGETPFPASRSPRANAAAAPAPSLGGRWNSTFGIPVIGINAVMLPTGRVLWFAYPKNPNRQYGDKNAPNEAQAFLWDPSRGTGAGAFKRVNPPLDPATGRPYNIWCAGQALLPDGRVVVAGGNLAYPSDTNKTFLGLNKVFTFNPWNETWTAQPDMSHGRWYPSQVLMPDGRMLIMGGLDEHGHNDANGSGVYTPNLGLDVFTPSPDLDGVGKVENLGTRGDTAANQPPDGGLYPHLFWMPSGRVFVAGPDETDSWFLHSPPDPVSAWGGNLASPQRWDNINDPSLRRAWGSAVLLPSANPATPSTTVEQIGGSNPIQAPGEPTTPADQDASTPGVQPSARSTESYDEAAADDTWHAGPSMNVGRSHLNTVLLPDLSMVSIGGGLGTTGPPKPDNQWAVSGSERAVDIFDRTSNSWHLGATQAEDRAYHSTALLMPDGRVVSAGDDYNGAGGAGTGLDNDTAQVYEPPYLFDGDGSPAARPTITSAPSFVAWGQTFHVDTPNTNITNAVLMAPGATTHANDMSQRAVPVAVQNASDGGVTITAPPAPNDNADVALPGYYMLFLLNDKGVPSVAHWISLSWNPVPTRTAPTWTTPGGAPAPGVVMKKPAVVTRDLVGPSISFTRAGLDARHGVIRGRVADTSGVKSFKVALGKRGKRCRWWSRRSRHFGRRRSCRKPAWMTATLKRTGKVDRWSVRLRHRIRRGRYIVSLRAVDKRGNVSARTGADSAKLAVR
jgi:hypothetical protein